MTPKCLSHFVFLFKLCFKFIIGQIKITNKSSFITDTSCVQKIVALIIGDVMSCNYRADIEQG